MTVPVADYKTVAAKKRAERNTHLIQKWLTPESELPTSKDVLKFPIESGYLTPQEILITQSNAFEISAKIKTKQWTALQVTEAFCHRSQIAHQLTNCLSEIFYNEALEHAKSLDEYYAKTGNLVGPFHGIPISLKDNINLKGKASTIGFVDWCFKPEGGMPYESAIAELLREQGAVFYVKTNVPTAMMMPETKNHVYGTTTNPYNRLLSAGGSSGGAAAHAALKGGVIDIGSDIGGSIRIPGSFNGVYCLRPTFGRYPTYGTRSGLPGLESANSVNGPLCASLQSMEFYLKNLANADPSTKDPKVSYRPWRDIKLPEKLSFAVLLDDGFVKPTPPITRGVKKVAELLENAGHEVIEWIPGREHARLPQLNNKFFVADGGKHVLEVTEATGEPLFPYMKDYGCSKELGVSELWDLQTEQTALAKSFLDKWMSTQNQTKSGKPIDAIIAPASPFAGSPLDKFGMYVGYTSVFSTLDYSVGVMPVTRASKELDLVEEGYLPKNDIDEYIWKNYDPAETDGGAVSVQVACRRSEDEKVVELLKVISKLVDYKA